MPRHTINIEIVVESELNQREMRDKVREALLEDQKFRGILKDFFNWSGNPGSLAYTVSNPPRTAHWST